MPTKTFADELRHTLNLTRTAEQVTRDRAALEHKAAVKAAFDQVLLNFKTTAAKAAAEGRDSATAYTATNGGSNTVLGKEWSAEKLGRQGRAGSVERFHFYGVAQLMVEWLKANDFEMEVVDSGAPPGAVYILASWKPKGSQGNPVDG